MDLNKDILKAINANREQSKLEHQALKAIVMEIKEDLRGNQERGIEGVIPVQKRHSIELGVLQEQVQAQKKIPKEGILGWFENHPNTIKYGLAIYFILFHGALAAKLLKLI